MEPPTPDPRDFRNRGKNLKMKKSSKTQGFPAFLIPQKCKNNRKIISSKMLCFIQVLEGFWKILMLRLRTTMIQSMSNRQISVRGVQKHHCQAQIVGRNALTTHTKFQLHFTHFNFEVEKNQLQS